MLNPYSVQWLYDLGLEEVERHNGRQATRAHEVGVERRRQGAAVAERALMLAQAARRPPRSRLVAALAHLAARLAPARPGRGPIGQSGHEQPATTS
jgi:hypothetical protein